MPRTTAPSTNPRILSGYAPYSKQASPDVKPKGSGSPTTTEERRQLLLDDPHARDVQPEQVTCAHCSKTVRLQKGKKYHLAHWLDHRWRCDRAATAEPQARAKCRSLPERKALLEADPDAQYIEADHVICGKCNKEVKFRKGRPYALSSWNQHKTSCHNIATSEVPSPSPSPSPTPSEQHTALTSDPLVASLESNRVKCALCLAWIDIALQTDTDVHIWRRHRASCVAENFADDKLGWTRPRFFRPRYRLAGPDTEAHARNSAETDDSPRAGGPDHTRDSPILPRITVAPASRTTSASPPPLSFSGVTSAATSAAPTPASSPRRRPSLFAVPSPRPEYTPLSLSRFERERGNVEFKAEHGAAYLKSGEHHHDKAGPGALGLHISPATSPPPYLQRTSLSLPLPKRYWRFESPE